MLLVTEVIEDDDCEWGKIHPSMFPEGFDKCNVYCDGWCLLVDSNDTPPIVYWKKMNKMVEMIMQDRNGMRAEKDRKVKITSI